MTFATTLDDSPYTITTQAIVRLDPAPSRQSFVSAAAVSKPEHTAVPRADDASLSHASLLIAHTLTLSDVRADRVAQLQQAITTGTYRVPAAAIAGKLTQTLQG